MCSVPEGNVLGPALGFDDAVKLPMKAIFPSMCFVISLMLMHSIDLDKKYFQRFMGKQIKKSTFGAILNPHVDFFS